ncbi:FG-GAP-like repeat-containing protein [Roseateles sp.]|uniref:FG-GAP-like repeat-containing protein n=1 Tax=Roseateles sp. TaxID=1971397 RepID=UPI0025D01B55|nr:FG-GAP-like repeat-containing protein [Roseateles sp.]MBV8034857.1 VCBS repeat-containing protein [Roseateles sp.]
MVTRKRDFDGDGRADIPVTSPWGLGLLSLTGGALSATVMAANGTRFGGWLLNTADNRLDLIGDFDGDGRVEMLVTSPWGIALLRKIGASFAPVVMAPNGTRFGDWLLNTGDNRFGPIGDFDGDGRDEILVTSPWGVGVLKLAGSGFTSILMAANGTRFGGWLLNTADNRFSAVGDLDGDRHDELMVTSPWGLGVLKLAGASFAAPVMAANGTRFGGWLLNTADNHIVTLADLDGDGRADIVITSPWGLGVLGLAGNTLNAKLMAPNGTRFGGWLLNTLDNRIIRAADLDGDGRNELIVTSPWGLGVLKLAGSSFSVPAMAANGTRFGGWLLNTADNHFDAVSDFNGDNRADLLVTSPWGLGLLRFTGSGFDALTMAANGTRFAGGWLLNTADNRFEVGEQTVRLHIKVLSTPTLPIDQMMQAMQRVYEAVGIRVHRVSTETLNLPALVDCDVGACTMGSTTGEQNTLFGNRNFAWGSDVVVYFVRSTVPAYNGCAAHPAGRPGAVVASIATQWTMAHEVGHVLGLPHVNDNNRLMTGNGTANITNPPPDLVSTEVNTMRAAPMTFAT